MSKTIVLKYGGAAMTDPLAAEQLMREVVTLGQTGAKIVLVHGGGPEIDRMLQRLGIEPKKVQGLRVTDAATMEVVEMVLAGRVNKALVSLLNRHGAKALGLSGRDAQVVRAKRKEIPEADLGLVGTVESVDGALLAALMASGCLPVLCSVAEDTSGNALNVNADEVAAAVAVALKADTLALLTDVPGVLRAYPDPASRIERMSVQETESLLNSGTIDKGMIPKLSSCIQVVRSGVGEARILDGRRPELLRLALESGTLGTTITAK